MEVEGENEEGGMSAERICRSIYRIAVHTRIDADKTPESRLESRLDLDLV